MRTTSEQHRYTPDFYGQHNRKESAEVVIDALLRFVPPPSSVVDVGCGVGSWLACFLAGGVADVHGVEGPWVEAHELMIQREALRFADLGEPVRFDRRFDVAVSVEVAEHLPQSRARTFVETLTDASDVVLFSAAIPGQGGRGHVNEQWPEYWAALFRECGYSAFDAIRPLIWNDRRVAWWYRQNIVLFVRCDATPRLVNLPEEGVLNLVHPELYESPGIKRSLRALGRAILNRLQR